MNKERSDKIVANWIFLGVGMLIVQVLLGGITRLTGSGLSITEWKPIMGIVPPIGDAQWQDAFSKYQQIAQYKYLNAHFTLSDFKFIFFWEWFHRLWARLISVVFLIPFVYFLTKKYIKKEMITPLVVLFLLGALQGAIGWIMVQSGLNEESVYVSHIRLAVHFVAAMVLICYALVFGLMLRIPQEQRPEAAGLRKGIIVIVALLTIHLFYGAFMAGLKAANAAPTWPLINGEFVPAGLFRNGFFSDIFFNRITVHFIHRTLAYVLFILIVIWWIKARKRTSSSVLNKVKSFPLIIVLIQILLGVISVFTSLKIVLGKFGIFEWFALVHQLFGMLLLLSLVALLYILKPLGK
ncbi:MAG: COX15/CtaA family protein [Chitinophagaceae bacterium]|jgi:cytochrome c oxidase assembly protein subunit 15|nr:COX15/CtaA family protein [Chitinophagaceae bacterium]